jgi:hypothetical protein
MLEDIGDHFSDRVVDLIVDTLDSCRRMGVPYKDAKAMVASVVASHLAETCSVFRMSQEQFLQLAAMAYQRHAGVGGQTARPPKIKIAPRGQGVLAAGRLVLLVHHNKRAQDSAGKARLQ